MAFKGGIKEAAKMLMGMGPSAQKTLIEQIRARDPHMASLLEENFVTMDDLRYLTPTMLVGLLRDVDLESFGLALRTVDKAVTDEIMGKLSSGIKLDIQDGLNGKPRRVSEVEAAQQKILEIVRNKIDLGQIVINPDGDELV